MKKITILLINILAINLFAGEGGEEFKYCNADTIYQFEYIAGSSIKVLKRREVYKYSNNKLMEYISQNWNEATSNFINNGKAFYAYDANGNQTESIFQNWNTTSNTFVNSSFYKEQYNSSNLITERVDYIWVIAMNNWKANRRDKYEYDANNNVSQITQERLNAALTALEFNDKYVYFYLPNKKIKQYISYNYNSATSTWVPNYNRYYLYNVDELIQEQQNQTWNSAINSWVNLNRYLFNYDINKNKKEEAFETWNSASNSWVNNNLYLYKYNSKNKIENMKYNRWIEGINVWDSVSKTDFFYNSSDKEIKSVYYLWNISGPWKINEMSNIEYDSKNNLTAQKNLYWNSDLNVLENYSERRYEYNSNDFVIAEEDIYDWNSAANYYNNRSRYEYRCPYVQNTELKNIIENEFKLFPNPINGNVLFIETLSQSDYEIVNMNGQNIKSGRLEKGINPIDISELSNGIYFIKNNNFTQKLIIQ